MAGKLMATLMTTAGAINFNTESSRTELREEIFGNDAKVPDSTSVAHVDAIDERGLRITISFVRGHIQGLIMKDVPIVAVLK